MSELPYVSIVFLAYNRREKLATSLEAMWSRSDYPRDRVEVIVVDNASSDGTAAMVRGDFPDVQLLERETNGGISAFNDGFARCAGDFVLALDDDCHLPPDGLRRAVAAAREHRADMVSFAIGLEGDDAFRFADDYPTGLLAFWGCAVLLRRDALRRLGGYDPEIFLWANELEFTLRFLDAGYRHLHLPEVIATHLKQRADTPFHPLAYRYNARNFAYVAAKLLRARDLPAVAFALLAQHLLNAVRVDRGALAGIPPWAAGLANGLRHRAPVRPAVSRLYRRHFHSFALPTGYLRTPSLWLGSGQQSRERPWRRDRFVAARGEYYPDRAGVLEV